MSPLLAYYALSAVTVLVSFGPSILLWRRRNKNLLDWSLSAVCAGVALVFAFFAGTWVLISLYLRFVAALFFVFALVRSYAGLKKRTIFAAGTKTGSVSINLRAVVIIAFTLLDILAIRGLFYKGEAVDLAFPLRGGTYGVLNIFRRPMTEIFSAQDLSQAYALDIIKIGPSGRRAQGVYPERLTYYNIYGEQIFSPCDGKVIKAVDGVFDNTPGEVNAVNPAGNHVIIACKGVNVVMAHLMKGTVYVRTGDNVKTWQKVAAAGNSGNSAEPHLHIHAVKASSQTATTDGEAAPITFNGKFLTMNGVFAAE